ncbi:MAG: zinc ribbon domain-containing protein [Desulfobacteraceae bacterium]|nr:MAG: zinc ribbon domain-containing protein [Desulfobacteraceae bacterium]
MPTYEYECEICGLKFERRQAISEPSISECPQCRGKVRRLISGGTAFILKGANPGRTGKTGESCSLEQTGTTCCGRQERCGKPPCK